MNGNSFLIIANFGMFVERYYFTQYRMTPGFGRSGLIHGAGFQLELQLPRVPYQLPVFPQVVTP